MEAFGTGPIPTICCILHAVLGFVRSQHNILSQCRHCVFPIDLKALQQTLGMINKMAYTAKDPCPQWHFMYLKETKSKRWEEGEGKKVSLKTHTTTRGMGKNLTPVYI